MFAKSKMIPTIDGLSSALLLLCLLAILYIGVIIIKIQAFEVASTTWQKTYNSNNGTQIGDNKVNTGGNHHMVKDTNGVVIVLRNYNLPVLKFLQERDKDVLYETPPGIGASIYDTNKKDISCNHSL